MSEIDTDDWWAVHLDEFTRDGRSDAGRGVFDPPHTTCSDEPQYQDENHAYELGFKARRLELGDTFRWK